MVPRTRKIVWTGLLLLVALVPLASAQAPPPLPPAVQQQGGFMDFDLFPERNFQHVTVALVGRGPGGVGLSNQANFNFEIRDTSYETNQQSPVLHKFDLNLGWKDGVQPEGWVLQDATYDIDQSFRGRVFSQNFVLQLDASKIPVKEAEVTLTVTMRHYYEQAREITVTKTENFTALVFPGPALLMQIQYEGEAGDGRTPLKAAPNTWIPIRINVSNADLYLARALVSVSVEPGEKVNPELVAVRGTGEYILEPSSYQVIELMLLTPKETTWYRGEPLQYTVRTVSAENPSIGVSSDSIVIIEGWYFSRPLMVVLPLLLLLFLLFVIILLVGKRYYDESILGKPIPPWRIPEEARALDQLRQNDPREFYITRYFLMVEEYESALNWFHGYKRRTKKGIKREAKSSRLADQAAALKTPSTDRFDRRADRIKRRMRRKQERRRLQLEAKLGRFQVKVEQHYEEDFEKDHKKWEQKVEKVKAKANRPWFKARKKWERQVEKIMADWEKPFAREKAKTEKAIAKAKEKYASQVKKKDKDTWRDWRDAVDANEAENRVREKEGRELLPEPVLVSAVVGPSDFPKPFKEPKQPTLPPEPEEPNVSGLPPEPKLALPKLEESHYAKKARRARKKTDRKVRRLERKTERLLAKNERDRVKAITKAGRKREKLLRKSHRVVQPTLMERLFRNTPEHRERRAHKKLLKALARERVKTVAESERARLDVLEVDAQRREAEILAKLVRRQAEVRKSGAAATMRAEEAPELLELKEANQTKLEREKLAAKKRVEAEKEKAAADLRRQLTEELVKERAERERLQEQKAAAILARAERKASRKETKSAAEPQVEPEEPQPKAAPKAEKPAKATKPKRAKK